MKFANKSYRPRDEMQSWTLESSLAKIFSTLTPTFHDWNTRPYRTLELHTTLPLHSRTLEFRGVMIILEKNQSL